MRGDGNKADEERSAPREFLKARRPHLFSDSYPVVEAELPQKVFEYHLDTITSRKEEADFENFCRRIAQREICPNLRPQTGPTGGGDSKADASSYEIDPELARRVFWGSTALPTSHRWCFAFSAKKDWAGKVRADVKGLVGIVPPPQKIYFITSRYARDKKRAEVEAELFQKHGVPVEILDRQWILTKTYEDAHTDLAVECFHIESGQVARKLGPKDSEREAELGPLLEQLKRPDENYSSNYMLVEEYLRAAHLARSVERPRHEVEGLLAQARRLAATTTPGQLLTANYDLAWTSFWWFDDAEQTLAIYEAMEARLEDLRDAHELELHANILNLLTTAVAQKRLDPASARTTDRFDALAAIAEKMATDRMRPANALHARTARAMMKLIPAYGDKRRISAALDELRSCLTGARGLVHYPLLSLADSLEQMGEFLANYPGYDDLFEALCELRGRLLGDREKAAMLLRNGYRLYHSERYSDALRALGSARRCALEKESVLLLARIALVTSLVYEASGLYWAARMEAAMAAHLAMTDARKESYASRPAALATMRLVWLEMRLGRIPCALAWHELAAGLVAVLGQRGENVDSWREELRGQDGVLSLFFIAADEDTLRHLTRLPDTLERLGLDWSRWALLFALGHEDILESEGFAESEAESRSDLYAKAFSQPAMVDIPTGAPTLHAASFDSVETNLLGMTLRLSHENEVSAIALAENLISATEAWFATATWDDILFLRSTLEVRIRETALASNDLPDPNELLTAEREILIPPSWAKTVHEADIGDRTFNEWVLRFLVSVTVQAAPRSGGGVKGFVKKLAQSETFDRALTYLPVSRMTMDDLGEDRQMLESWSTGTDYPMRRAQAWWKCALREERTNAVALFKSRSAQPSITVADLIDVAMWDKAKWHAAVQLVYLDAPDVLPVLGLAFRNPAAGANLFEGMKARLAKGGERLRVAVILGEGGRKCTSYAITVGPDFGVTASAVSQPRGDPTALFVGTVRVLQLKRTSDALSMFLDDAKAKGKFTLVPAAIAGSDWRFCWDVGIECNDLVVRAVSDVAMTGDQDAVAARTLRTTAKARSRAAVSRKKDARKKAKPKPRARSRRSSVKKKDARKKAKPKPRARSRRSSETIGKKK